MEILKLKFEILETKDFGIWNNEILKFLKFKILRLKAWALKLGILGVCGLKFFATSNFGDFEFKNWAFRM